jgi:HPt (histidine-containing phosphotransfer) domain-containing protein
MQKLKKIEYANKAFIEEKSRQLHVSDKAVVKLIGLAIQETEEQLPLLNHAIKINDYEGIQTISHRIKGYLLNLKFDELGSIAQEINYLALSKSDICQIKEKFEQFKVGFETIKKDIQSYVSQT